MDNNDYIYPFCEQPFITVRTTPGLEIGECKKMVKETCLPNNPMIIATSKGIVCDHLITF